MVDRVVLDNTSLAVKDVLVGRDRVQTEAFEAFRGGYPFRAEFCAPAKGGYRHLQQSRAEGPTVGPQPRGRTPDGA